jgi:transcriptional regulator with XRE-family HTH domain
MKVKSELAVRVGAEVRRLRTERKRSQEAFAVDCGIARSYMGAIERGNKTMSIDMAKRVTDGLGVTLSELFANVGE